MSGPLFQQIDDELSRLACEAVVNQGAAALPALREALKAVASRLEAEAQPGLDEIADLVRRAAAIAVAGDEQTTLFIVEKAWTDWKVGRPATQEPPPATTSGGPSPEGSGAPVVSDARVEEDVDALKADPELSGMFIGEALDHLSTIEATVLALEAAPGDVKLLNDMFRPFHTVKGNSGALGVRTVQELAHRVESLLDLGRSGKHHIGEAETEIILEAVDLLTGMITDLGRRLNGDAGRDFEPERLRLMTAVETLIAAGDATPIPTPGGAAPVEATAVSDEPSTGGAVDAPVPGPDAAGSRDAGPRQPFQRRADDTAAAAATSVKVDTRKLDNLVDMVGELVIVQSIIQEDPHLRATDERLTRNLAQLRRITSDLQRNAMSMRMVPIRQTLQKMSRLVRDLSKKSGKQVDLVLSGEDTELDRKVVEDINDPLMHMVRNSMDHGLEDPAVRAERGKNPVGRLSLSAYHQGGNIVIAVTDDGQGLNVDRIMAKAVSQGLVEPGATLPPSEIYQLIFKPGFSTADQVTEISGRGVGMDVVRRNIDALRGRIDIQSTPGEGTTFLIKLPLTLAIVDGLILRVAHQRFVLPTFSVRESLRPPREHVHTVQGRPCMIQVRNSLIPLLRLAELFGVAGALEDAWEGTVVVIEDDGERVALMVDELVGKQEVVIKSLGGAFANVRGVAGGAILGDGRIGLILDGNGIVRATRTSEARAA